MFTLVEFCQTIKGAIYEQQSESISKNYQRQEFHT